MRRAIAAAMSRSKREIPHYYLEHSIDISKAQDWLQAHNAERTPEQRLLLGALLVRAAALTLKQTPELNGYYTDGRFDPSSSVHIGMAINIRGGGLVVPALLDADQASLEQLMERLKDLTGRARHGGLRSSEMSAATVTLTSLGDRGVDSVLGVIFPPQVAILGFGTPVLRPWITDTGSVEARPVLRVTLAADHRVSDGHLGARFLRELTRKLQSPESL
ncbi:2-oxo acid dehydrogenase subunit E2 [Marinobacterium aestuariivivens]|uniref:2-oxo acid dehydrogenase subunit E2 n=1 Tax=Marinobacterium aestuariivivens TaxID=1698799 RepID=A0ABW1ZYB4_9GAMM